MKKYIIYLSALLTSGAALYGQDLDPTIEVSREYEGKLIEAHKPPVEMSVPDTLHHFDLEFDYSVFDNPYKGSYEFSPYILEMRPAASARQGNQFYLRAGAGYTLHPTLDVVWSPLRKGALSMDVYASGDSYVGQYRAVASNPAWKGYEVVSTAGADLVYDWKKAALDFGVSYNGFADKDYVRSRMCNGVDAYATLRSKSSWPENFMYRVSVSYGYSKERNALYKAMGMHDFGIDATFGPSLRHGGKVLVDVGLEMESYSGPVSSLSGAFYAVPRYVWSKGRFKVDAGVRVSVLMGGDALKGKGQVVYPAVKMNLDILPEAMRMYLNVGGGDKLLNYRDMLKDNPHFDLSYGLDGLFAVPGVSAERISASVGLAGRVGSFFSYDLRGGYVNYKNSPLAAAVPLSDGGYRPALAYSAYEKAFAAFDWRFHIQHLRFDGAVEYTYSWGIDGLYVISPAVLTGNASLLYDWNRRIYAGVDCRFSTSRASEIGFVMPWYADAGVYAEYVVNSKISVWLRGGNLLNMEIQRSPLFAEKGINFTAGICLTF